MFVVRRKPVDWMNKGRRYLLDEYSPPLLSTPPSEKITINLFPNVDLPIDCVQYSTEMFRDRRVAVERVRPGTTGSGFFAGEWPVWVRLSVFTGNERTPDRASSV